MLSNKINLTDFDRFVLSKYPYPIAANYRKVLDAQDWRSKVELALALFEYGLRTIAIGVISQYLIRDAENVSDPALNNLLLRKLPQATLGSWKEIFFTALKAYQGKRDLFFMKELYDLYWDTSFSPHRQRPGVQRPFDRLIQIRNDLAHRPKPTTELGWQTVANEVVANLREILEKFVFIQNYDLVHITHRNGSEYTYTLFSGEYPSISSTPLHSSKELQTGWFYLSKQSRDFLQLHPLLIFWEDSESASTAPSLGDAAIYDTFNKESVNYIATVLHKFVQNPSLVSEFVRILYYNIEKVKRLRREAHRLSWQLLQDVARQIADQRFGDVRAKYRQELYLQRQDIRNAFSDFLASDKTAFLLLGKSGVGKSNFFVSLADEFQSQDKTCFLFYNGAKLDTDKSLGEIIGHDFESHLRLMGDMGEVGFKDFLAEIARIEGIEAHQVVLFIDAVNENADAKNLLRRIDTLIGDSSTYPWFKVVLSSRPEAWKAIKRGVKLAEHRYYRLPGQEELGIELQPFSIGVEMTPFTRGELPLVYERYRKAYNLQTPYEGIPPKLRCLLNDPLTLKLVAETNRGHAIPTSIRLGEIYQDYVRQLIRDERLQPADLVFLEHDLMSLMITNEHYANSIGTQQINTTYTGSGRRLFELIQNDELLSNGQRVNQSFTNLVDAEILVMRGTPPDYEIGFKYERFYDYYAGKRLYQLSQGQSDRSLFFTSLIQQTVKQPFLWGAVKNAIIQDAKDNGTAIILDLCFTAQQHVKEMMVKVLCDLGRDAPSQVEGLLQDLVPTQANPSALCKAWQLIRNPKATNDKRTRNAKKIAIEVASELNISRVLQAAASQADPELRAAAVRYTYHLWQREPDEGFVVLENLSQRATSGVIPDFAVLESVLGLSLAIFFDYTHEREVLSRLQSIWHSILSKLLVINESESHRGKVIHNFLRERIISFLITLVFRLFQEMPQYTVVNYPDFNAFFSRTAEEKALYRRLTRYLDVDGDYSPLEMENDFLAVLRVRDMLISGVAVMGMTAHFMRAPLEFLPFLKKYFTQALADPVPNDQLSGVPQILTAVLDRTPEMDDLFDYFLYTVNICQDYYSKHRKIPGLNRIYHAPEVMYFGPYILYQYQRTGSIKSDWLEAHIDTAFQRNDIASFDFILQTELPLVAIEMRRPRIALEALAQFFGRRNQSINPKIQKFLSRLRIYYPDEVDDFLEEQSASEEFRLQVQTNEPIETVGELIGLRSWLFFRDEVINGSPALRSRLIRVLERAVDCKDGKQWVDYIIRELVNLIYGGEALRQI